MELSELIVTGIASPGEKTLDAIINSVLDGVMLSPKYPPTLFSVINETD